MAGCRFSEEIQACGEPAREYVRIKD